MSIEHENLHELLGAFVLGGLDPQEHRAFTVHLRSCAECQREAAQLSSLRDLLSLVPMEVPGTAGSATARSAVPAPPASLTDRIRRDRRRRRVWTGALIAAVAAGFLVLGFAIRPAFTGPSSSTVQAAPSINVTAVPDDPAQPVEAALQMFPKQWGPS